MRCSGSHWVDSSPQVAAAQLRGVSQPPTSVTRTAAVFEITYRARGLPDDEAAVRREELDALGAVRLRPLRLPEAGGSHEVWTTLHFVGSAIVGGIIEHIASRYFDRLAAALGRFFRTKATKGSGLEMSLNIHYDDVDLDIGPITEQGVAELPQLAQSVHDHLHRPGLAQKPVTRIVIGMIRDGDQWEEPHLQQWPEEMRYWGISFEGHRAVTHIYDTESGLLAERPEPRSDMRIG